MGARGRAGVVSEHTNLPQLPVVDQQLRPVSVDQGTEAEAVLPAARGEVVGWPEGEWGQALRAKQGSPFFQNEPTTPEQELGEHRVEEPACCQSQAPG